MSKKQKYQEQVNKGKDTHRGRLLKITVIKRLWIMSV